VETRRFRVPPRYRSRAPANPPTDTRREEPQVLGIDDVTTIIVNFRTLDATRTCLTTLRAAYPSLRVIVVDNGSGDGSTEFLRRLAHEDGRLCVIFNASNIFHGPALDQAMRAAETDLVFLLDSDCEILHGGFLEPLVDAFSEDPLLYAMGRRSYANRYGFRPISDRERWTYYISPFAAMIDRTKYFTLPPFVHHGAPLYRNMWGATRAGYHFRHAMIEDHVRHVGRATAGVHGYGFNRRLRLQEMANAFDRRLRRATSRLLRRELRPPERLSARTGEPPEASERERERADAPVPR
jgi:glycosyltransferase involved in cell wall biosynthesis